MEANAHRTTPDPFEAILTLQYAAGNRAVNHLLQPKTSEPVHGVTDTPPIVQDLLRSPGKPLDPVISIATAWPANDGPDQVRIHTDPMAQEAADSINSHAFTVGNDIYFGRDQFAPNTSSGQELLGHELSHIAEQTGKGSSSLTAGAGAYVQRKSLSKDDLEKKYNIKIEKGDTGWSDKDIEDLSWALARLSKQEAALLKGYRFLRWRDRESRMEVDPTYEPKGEEEAGLHEPNEKKGIFKISMYDAAFTENSTMPSEFPGQNQRGDQPIGRFNILHEVGHAMSTADKRMAVSSYGRAKPEYDQLLERHNSTNSATEQKALRAQLGQKEKEVDAFANRLTTSNERVLDEFAKLTKDMKPVTPDATINTKEAFAETFAVYKLNPKGIEKENPRLAAWFKRQGYLFDGK